MGLTNLFDPTKSWETVGGLAPDPGAQSLQLSSLPFGSPIESARALGRPDHFEWNSRLEKQCTLVYAKSGLRLRFEKDRLVEVIYLIGTGARPMSPKGTRLTPEVDRASIASIFGEPDPDGSDDTCLQIFHGNGVVSDFILDDGGHLQEWHLYPDD